MPFRYIAIEGPIGAGKTALAERLAARLDATLVGGTAAAKAGAIPHAAVLPRGQFPVPGQA